MDIATEYFSKDNECVTREIAGETIIVPVRSRVGDLDSIYTLNEVGTMIWQLINGRNSVGQIAEAIQRVYDVGTEAATRDAIDFLDALKSAGLIRNAIENHPPRD